MRRRILPLPLWEGVEGRGRGVRTFNQPLPQGEGEHSLLPSGAYPDAHGGIPPACKYLPPHVPSENLRGRGRGRGRHGVVPALATHGSYRAAVARPDDISSLHFSSTSLSGYRRCTCHGQARPGHRVHEAWDTLPQRPGRLQEDDRVKPYVRQDEAGNGRGRTRPTPNPSGSRHVPSMSASAHLLV